MTQAEINQTIKDTWTKQLQNSSQSLTDNILEGYATWVKNLVKAATEQQAQQAQPQQQMPVTQKQEASA